MLCMFLRCKRIWGKPRGFGKASLDFWKFSTFSNKLLLELHPHGTLRWVSVSVAQQLPSLSETKYKIFHVA